MGVRYLQTLILKLGMVRLGRFGMNFFVILL
ncbi:Putative uncharacterized protein [Lactococcus lactis subsp. lactis A12]|uniref:Uncharacterized protein n=1 Tax=Lactococcus lactis subsp. lactis A12 TaxID=1137134 RepID=S6EUL9_LACLL|nr:Putative uncharacterized protein [Lactococcus lactis subsp. lactis A12]SBW30677.1 Hypothetical protein LLA12_01526 [Lactococcus lactis subsp. lactis]